MNLLGTTQGECPKAIIVEYFMRPRGNKWNQVLRRLAVVAIALAMIPVLGCSSATRQKVKDHRLILRPGTNIVPRPVEHMGERETEQQDFENGTETIMIIFRGRM